MLFRHLARAAAILALCAGSVAAQDKSFTLAAPASLEANGFLQYVIPRFALKTGGHVDLRVSDSVGPDLDPSVDLALTPLREVTAGGAARRGRPVFAPITGEGPAFRLIHAKPRGARREYAIRFADWLASDTGQRTVEAFAIDGAPVYLARVAEEEEDTGPIFTGDAAQGRKLSLALCGRCHVIDDSNRMKGLGSTPSFPALRSFPDWASRFEAFYVLNPHPSFTMIEDLTPPFHASRPPPIAPIEMTQGDLESILAFVESIEAADLGAPVEFR